MVFLPRDRIAAGFTTIINYLDHHLPEILQLDKDAGPKVDKFVKYVER